ncbi:MAG: hypothetical protein V7746_23225 [Halioglobus sp.]
MYRSKAITLGTSIAAGATAAETGQEANQYPPHAARKALKHANIVDLDISGK